MLVIPIWFNNTPPFHACGFILVLSGVHSSHSNRSNCEPMAINPSYDNDISILLDAQNLCEHWAQFYTD